MINTDNSLHARPSAQFTSPHTAADSRSTTPASPGRFTAAALLAPLPVPPVTSRPPRPQPIIKQHLSTFSGHVPFSQTQLGSLQSQH